MTKTTNESQAISITIDGGNFMLPKPIVLPRVDEEQDTSPWGRAFDFWNDPSEDGYEFEDGDEPSK